MNNDYIRLVYISHLINLSFTTRVFIKHFRLEQLLIQPLRAGTIYRFIDIWKADMRIDTIYEISFYYNYSILTNEYSRYPSRKPETVMFR